MIFSRGLVMSATASSLLVSGSMVKGDSKLIFHLPGEMVVTDMGMIGH